LPDGALALPTVSRRLLLIVNPAAGAGRAARVLPQVQAALTDHGLTHRTEPTRNLEHARSLAREASDAGEVAVTLGGDGLVGCVAGVLSQIPDSVLGVLPGGRGNDLARVLDIPPDPVAATAVIADGVERGIDLGEVDGRPFIGVASVGFDSEANRIANDAPARLGNLVYAYGALRALASWRPACFELELDGVRRSFTGYSVVAANSRAYGGGMLIAPDALLDDGRLDVIISAHTPRWRFLASLPKVFQGRHVHEPTVSVSRCDQLRISADRSFTVYADGDPIAELPVMVTVRPRAVRVLCPLRAPAALSPESVSPP